MHNIGNPLASVPGVHPAAIPASSSLDPFEEIFDRIFSANQTELTTLLSPLVPQKSSEAGFGRLITLIDRIFSDETHQEGQKSSIIQTISSLPWFPALMDEMLVSKPKTFILTVLAMEETPQTELINAFIERDKHAEYVNVLKCLQCFNQPGWQNWESKAEAFDDFLNLLDEEQFEETVEIAVANCSVAELGRVLALTDSTETAYGFITALITYYQEDEDYEGILVQFVENIVTSSSEALEKQKPVILLELLNFRECYPEPRTTLLSKKESLPPAVFAHLLWCMPERKLKSFFTDFPIQEHCPAHIEWLQQIFALESGAASRLRIMKRYASDLDEDDLMLLATNLLINESTLTPYLCPALSRESFQVFALIFDPALRSNLLRRALTDDVNLNRKLLRVLKRNLPKWETLCNTTTIDVVSQKLIHIGDDHFGKMATLKDFSDYIAEGVASGDLDDKMARTENDFLQIPPFLIGAAMQNGALRPQFIAVLRYMSDEQLLAFAQQIPKRGAAEVIDLMMKEASTHQMNAILDEMPFSVLEAYLRAKSAELHDYFEPLLVRRGEIQARIAKLSIPGASSQEGFQDFHHESLEICTKYEGELRRLLTPVFQSLGQHAKELFCYYELDRPEDFSRIFNNLELCRTFQEELRGSFRKLEEISPETEASGAPQQDFPLRKIPIRFRRQKGINTAFLRDRGIISVQDVIALGIDLEDKKILLPEDLDTLQAYLAQSKKLSEIWAFFKEKQLGSISDLFSTVIVEDSAQLLNLISIAGKLGFKG